jgi:hypothetical protein
MPADRHKHTPLRFRPRPDDRARLAAFQAATGRPVNAILADALAAWLDAHPVGDDLDSVTGSASRTEPA